MKISALIEGSVDNSPSHQSVGPSQDGPGADNLSIKFVGKFDDLAGSQTKTFVSSIRNLTQPDFAQRLRERNVHNDTFQ